MTASRLKDFINNLRVQDRIPIHHIARATRVAVALYPEDVELLSQRQWILGLMCSVEIAYRPDPMSEQNWKEVNEMRASFLDICQRVLAIDDTDPEDWYFFSCALQHIERYDESLDAALKAHDIEPAPDKVCRVVSVLCSLERYQSALDFIDASEHGRHEDVIAERHDLVRYLRK